ncbi:7344_t:CDS:2 [Dentiscutata heterogama]|uniref:7344_t:CDS:1 n=1 Tax=Dentiscutata heterogama TaxID=1316150 RepID=A0ACA9JVP9_9GLOM|nr:7344_t:CDS:2 [Dentiscutata heterogama]
MSRHYSYYRDYYGSFFRSTPPAPPRYQNIQNDRENDLVELFGTFGSIQTWNGYPLLFIMVCNIDYKSNSKDSGTGKVLEQLAEIQELIEKIDKHGGASPSKLESIKEILNEYKNLRLFHEEKKMSQLIDRIGEELRPRYIKNLKEFLKQLQNVTFQQRLILREICVNRIASFSDFADYINYFRDNRFQQSLDKLITGEKNDRISKARNISGSAEYDEFKQSSRQIEKSYNKTSNVNNETAKLLEENKKLKLEAARHQAALGNVVNFRWRDDDPNNSMQLIKDIEKLQRDLQSFTGVKGTQINQEAASELFKKYNCSTKFEDKAMKVVLAAVLQRRVLDLIYDISENFKRQIQPTNINLEDDQLEAGICSRTSELVPMITRFSEVNPGNDEHTRVLPIKLRQQIYAALSNRGFINQKDHSLVQQTLENLIKEMECYRKIESKDKNKQLVVKATSIIQQVLNIFCFRLNTQEPIPNIRFYESGEPIDIELMDGIWQGDVKDFEVEICSFPAIVIECEKRTRSTYNIRNRNKSIMINENNQSDKVLWPCYKNKVWTRVQKNFSNERKRPKCENVQEFSFPKRVKGELKDQKSEIGPSYKFENQYIPPLGFQQHIYFDNNINEGNLNQAKNLLLAGRVKKTDMQNQMSLRSNYNNRTQKTQDIPNMESRRFLEHKERNEMDLKSDDFIIKNSISSHSLNKKKTNKKNTTYKNGYCVNHSFKKKVQHAWGIESDEPSTIIVRYSKKYSVKKKSDNSSSCSLNSKEFNPWEPWANQQEFELALNKIDRYYQASNLIDNEILLDS